MLDQPKNILIDEDLQKKLDYLQTHYKNLEGITYSEAAIFRRAVHILYTQAKIKSDETN